MPHGVPSMSSWPRGAPAPVAGAWCASRRLLPHRGERRWPPPAAPGAESGRTSRAFGNALRRDARSNVGLPTSGRGRTDVRRQRPHRVLRKTRDCTPTHTRLRTTTRAPNRPPALFPSVMLFWRRRPAPAADALRRAQACDWLTHRVRDHGRTRADHRRDYEVEPRGRGALDSTAHGAAHAARRDVRVPRSQARMVDADNQIDHGDSLTTLDVDRIGKEA